MLQVLVVLRAEIFKEFSVRHEAHFVRSGPGFRVSLRIGDGGLKSDMPEVASREALGDMQRVAVRMAARVNPGFIVEAGGFYNQRVAFPMPDGVAHPGWIGIGRNGAAVRKDLAKIANGLVEKNDLARELEDFVGVWNRVYLRYTGQLAVAHGIVLTEIALPLFIELRGPGGHGNVPRFEIGGEVDGVLDAVRLRPQTGEIGFAIGGARRGGR